MKAAICFFVVTLTLLLAPARPEPVRPAAGQRYAISAVTTRLFELGPNDALPALVRDGRRRAEVGALDVAMALPVGLLRESAVAPVAAVACSSLLLAALALSFATRLQRTTALSTGRVFFATGALVACTSCVTALRRGDAVVLAAWALWLMLDLLSVSEARRGQGIKVGLLAAVLTLATPAYAGAALALVVLDVLRRRSAAPAGARAWALAAGVAPVLLALVGGRLWDARVALAVEPSRATLHALYGLLLSPGRSAFVYTPLLLAGALALPGWWARERLRAEAVVVATILGLLGVAGRADWHGEPGFGPWLVLPLVPAWVEPAAGLLAGGRSSRAWFGIAAAAGLAVQLLGVVVDVEAWPQLVSDVRAATGAPGWFLDPAADTEFIPQLSPLVGQLTLLRLSRGGAVSPPPFSLVVGSDQAEPAGKSAADTAWLETWSRFDKRKLTPNLAWVAAPPATSRLQLGAAAASALAALVCLWRARARARSL